MYNAMIYKDVISHPYIDQSSSSIFSIAAWLKFLLKYKHFKPSKEFME